MVLHGKRLPLSKKHVVAGKYCARAYLMLIQEVIFRAPPVTCRCGKKYSL
jgi:hypothetical protein